MVHHLEVSKTARYFSTECETPQELWIALHGYGHSPERFIKRFDLIADSSRLIVAPEGLHRFYTSGLSGDVGASWMTREDRENDIRDYVSYLDQLVEHLRAQHSTIQKLVVLGFSQGGATATRWTCQGATSVDQLYLWAPSFPQDLIFPDAAHILNRTNLKICLGDEDPYVTPEIEQKLTGLLESRAIEYQLIHYKGGHSVDRDVLVRMAT